MSNQHCPAVKKKWTRELRAERQEKGTGEQRSSTARGAGHDLGAQIPGGSLLQEHSTGGEGGQGLIGPFTPGAGQAVGNGELLRGAEQETEDRNTWEIAVCGGPCA